LSRLLAPQWFVRGRRAVLIVLRPHAWRATDETGITCHRPLRAGRDAVMDPDGAYDPPPYAQSTTRFACLGSTGWYICRPHDLIEIQALSCLRSADTARPLSTHAASALPGSKSSSGYRWRCRRRPACGIIPSGSSEQPSSWRHAHGSRLSCNISSCRCVLSPSLLCAEIDDASEFSAPLNVFPNFLSYMAERIS